MRIKYILEKEKQLFAELSSLLSREFDILFESLVEEGRGKGTRLARYKREANASLRTASCKPFNRDIRSRVCSRLWAASGKKVGGEGYAEGKERRERRVAALSEHPYAYYASSSPDGSGLTRGHPLAALDVRSVARRGAEFGRGWPSAAERRRLGPRGAEGERRWMTRHGAARELKRLINI